MSAKLCTCPGRKCRSVFTPLVKDYVNDHLSEPLDTLKEWVIQRIEWREQQETELGKGVKPENVATAIERVKSCKSKARLIDLMNNQSNKMHRVIDQATSELQGLNDDCPIQ